MSLLDTLNNPSMMHAAIVHFPIVLFVLAVPVAGLAVALRNQLWIRCLSLVLFAGLAVSCWLAEETGEKAQSKVPAEMEQVIWDQINEHEEMAELLKFVAAAGLLFSLISLIPHPWFRASGTLLSLCVALAGAIMTAVTAHYGGDLVYTHGVGTTLLEKRIESEKAAAAAAAAAQASAGTPAPAAPVDPELVPIREIVMSEAEGVSFKNDIWPIIEKRCLDCHDGPEGDGAYDVTTVATMSKAGEKGGPGIVPGQPDESSIVKYIRGELKPRMPKKKPPMPEEELHLIRLWIAAGAKDDSASPATLPVEAVPAPAAAPVVVEIAPVATEAVMPVEAPAEEVAPVEAPQPEVMQESAPVVAETPTPAEEVVEVEPVMEEMQAPAAVEAAPVEVAPAATETVPAPETPAPVTPESTPAEAPTEAPVAPVEIPATSTEPPVVETQEMETQVMEASPSPEVAAPAEATATFDPFAAPAPAPVTAPAEAGSEAPVQMEEAPAVPAAPVDESEFEPEAATAGG